MHIKLREALVLQSKKQSDLEKLTATPFDINKENQLAVLKNYIDKFEYCANKNYLIQDMMYVYATTWGLSLFSSLYIPLVDYPEWIVRYCFFKVLLLSQLDGTNFNEQLLEMKTIYNWCLKGGQEHYNPSIDNTKKLEHPEIVRLITLLAPLCDVEFMMAWKNVVDNPQKQTSSWGSNLSSCTSMLRSAVSFGYSVYSKGLSEATKPSEEAEKVHKLKIAVETGALSLDFVKSGVQACQYFALSSSFKSLVVKSATQSLRSLSEPHIAEIAAIDMKSMGLK